MGATSPIPDRLPEEPQPAVEQAVPSGVPVDPDWEGWPPSEDDDDDGRKKIFEAKVAARGRRIDAAIARAKANRDADLAQNAEFQKGLLEAAKTGLDRARTNAETVQKAAGAIGTIYTGILGLAFSITSRPMPTRGVLPALFLGVAVASSTAYLAYISRREDTTTLQMNARARGMEGQFERVTFMVRWIRRSVRLRLWLLRSSVVALAVGVSLLPLPFIDLREPLTTPPDVPAWPNPEGSLDDELQKIKFQAQVNEVSQLRAAQSTAPNDMRLTIGVGLVGLTLVIIGGVTDKPKDELQIMGPEVKRKRG